MKHLLLPFLNPLSYVIPFILLALFYYGALYLPAKQQRSMLLKLKIGDTIVTQSGLVGTLISIDGEWCIIKLENDAHARITRESITAQL